jgi:hypothetical protein
VISGVLVLAGIAYVFYVKKNYKPNNYKPNNDSLEIEMK